MKIVLAYFLVGLIFSVGTQIKYAWGNWRSYEGPLGENMIDIVAITFMWPFYLAASAYVLAIKGVGHIQGKTEWNYQLGIWAYPGWDDNCPNPGCNSKRN